MTTKVLAISAGGVVEYHELADFFRLLDTTGPVTVRCYLHGALVSTADDIEAGYAERFQHAFDKIAISSATAQNVRIAITHGGEVRYDRSAGAVDATILGPTSSDSGSVTAVNWQTELMPADPDRVAWHVHNTNAFYGVRLYIQDSLGDAFHALTLQPGEAYRETDYAAARVLVMTDSGSFTVPFMEFFK